MNIAERHREYSSDRLSKKRQGTKKEQSSLLTAIVLTSLISASPAALAETRQEAPLEVVSTELKETKLKGTEPKRTEHSHTFLPTTDAELTPPPPPYSSEQQTLLSPVIPASAPPYRNIETSQIHLDQLSTDHLELSQKELVQAEELAQTEPISAIEFGEAGTQRWYLQAGAASDFDDDSFLLTGVGISHFFYDGHSANLELNGLSVSQPGADALGATLTFLVRSHWIRAENWSIYVDGGAGIIFTTGDVPEVGSSFNFTPQVGGGASFAINENQRIMTGLRWYHISNADTFESNPGLDTLFGYVGINFPL